MYQVDAGCGLLRVAPDLTRQELIELPPILTDVNFHSTKIGRFDGKTRLFLAANMDAEVVVMTLDGDIDFILPTPELEEYMAEETVFKPTDTALVAERLLVADGYGANYILEADPAGRRWTGLFGGKTETDEAHGRFGKAHGMNPTPDGGCMAIADRPFSRVEISTFDGTHVRSHGLPRGSRPCGIDFRKVGGAWFAAVASLDDPVEGRSAPIYVLDEDYRIVSTIRPKEDLGIEPADHIHNVVWHEIDGTLYLVCQSWNPGCYFVLAQSS